MILGELGVISLFDLAQRRPDPIPFFGELGSVNPVVVRPVPQVRQVRRVLSEVGLI